MESLKQYLQNQKSQIKSTLITTNRTYLMRSDLEPIFNDSDGPNRKELKLSNSEQENSIDPKTNNQDENSQSYTTPTINKVESPIKLECQSKLARSEVVRRLRLRREPIRLFAESDYECYQRLKRLELFDPEEKSTSVNDYKAAMDRVQLEYEQEMFKNPSKSDHADHHTAVGLSAGLDQSIKGLGNGQEVMVKDCVLTEEELEEIRLSLSSYVAERMRVTNKKNISKLDDEMLLHAEKVLMYFKHLFALWGRELNSRSKEDKEHFQGRKTSAIYTQTLEYIRPLLRKLKEQQISMDILDSLIKITTFCLEKNYIKANDAYLELSIGNAPWPLGVTNHGIHARTAQEKIHAKNVAHVLNDETQRKFIQAVKRLMTKAQVFYPTLPSLCVNFMG